MIVGFIGGGNMAEALIKGLSMHKYGDILFYDPSEQRIHHLMRTYGVGYVGTNAEVLKRSDIIILAVKPQIIQDVLDELSRVPKTGKIFVSIAAGIGLSYLQDKLDTKKVVRVMPNTPALVQAGMSVLSPSEDINDKELEDVKGIFSALGKVCVLPEDKMNAVTALSGSGPGFIALFVESMIKGGTKIGLSEEESSMLAIQTFIGAAKMFESGVSPVRLREMVTSPKGTTYAGLCVLKDRAIEEIIAETLEAARARADVLGSKTNA